MKALGLEEASLAGGRQPEPLKGPWSQAGEGPEAPGTGLHQSRGVWLNQKPGNHNDKGEFEGR